MYRHTVSILITQSALLFMFQWNRHFMILRVWPWPLRYEPEFYVTRILIVINICVKVDLIPFSNFCVMVETRIVMDNDLSPPSMTRTSEGPHFYERHTFSVIIICVKFNIITFSSFREMAETQFLTDAFRQCDN